MIIIFKSLFYWKLIFLALMCNGTAHQYDRRLVSVTWQTFNMLHFFSNHFIWITPWLLFSALIIITLRTKEAYWRTLRLFNNGFFAFVCKRMKKYKTATSFNCEDVLQMLHFLKLIRFTLLFYFSSSDQSEIVD